jgi:NAD(P)H-dependent flavin oxidoreductase YrpB (nitropropane dioxygenase family)
VRTAFTEIVGVEHPLAGFNRSPGVVAAVTNAGGLGVLGASSYSPEELDATLRWIEEQVHGRPYGVDLLVPTQTTERDPADLLNSLRAQIPDSHRNFVRDLLARYGIPERPENLVADAMARRAATFSGENTGELLDVAFSHRISLVANALGTPPPYLVERAKEEGVPVAALIGEAKHAVRQLEAGVDVLVAQGTEAGGHTGMIATMVLTPEIVELAGDAPVLAAGGIATGAQMAASLALGAAGVWCGSVWLSSHEDITPEVIKRKYLAAGSADTLRSRTRTGKPARMLRSAWHDEWEKPDSPGTLPMPLQPVLVAEAWDRIDAAAMDGNPKAEELESFFIGQVVGTFKELRPAYDIARDMITGCERRLRELSALAAGAPSRLAPQHALEGDLPGDVDFS